MSLAGVCALALAGLTALVVIYPINSIDEGIARGIQSVSVGPLTSVFDAYRQIGGPYGLEGEAAVFLLVLLVNWRAWKLLVAGALASGWYFGLVGLILRARPSVPDVLRVTEHPGHSSYPSGHMILFTFYAVILMVVLGHKYIPKNWQWLGWLLAIAFVLLGGFSRVYSGAHWPSDVLGGLLIAVGWLAFVLSIRWVSDPVLREQGVKSGGVGMKSYLGHYEGASKGWGPWREDWYSFCSAHRISVETCQTCMTGAYGNRWGGRIEHGVAKYAYGLWYWWVNREGSNARGRIEEVFVNLRKERQG